MGNKFAPNSIIDSEDDKVNKTGILRHRFSVKSGTTHLKRYFYYIIKKGEGMPPVSCDGKYWQEVYNNVIYRINTRSRDPECNNDSSNNSNKKNRITPAKNDLSSDSDISIFKCDDNTWTTSKNTRAIFGASDDVVDLRLFLSERIVDLESIVNMEKPISSILTTPQWECTKELSEMQLMYIRDRAMYLHLAYCLALDGHFIADKKDAGFFNCCEKAIELLNSVGFKIISNPRTLMKWNREYRICGKFRHPFETIKLTEPRIFHLTWMEKKKDFDQCITNSLNHITRTHCRNFNRHVRRYMLAYDHFHRSNDEISFSVIEKFVKKTSTHRSSLDKDTAIIDKTVAEAISSLNFGNQ